MGRLGDDGSNPNYSVNRDVAVRARSRALALLTLGLLAAYHVLRAIAAQCRGSQCDAYIGLTLVLPLVILVVVVATGLMAIAAARQREQEVAERATKRGQITWLSFLSACTRVGVFGPIVSIALLRSNPDLLLPLATLLAALVPVSAMTFSFFAYRHASGPPAP